MERSNGTPPPPLSPDRRVTPASVDLVALCHSLPADGHLSNQDVEALKDWQLRYVDVRLPSQAYVSDVVNKALTNQLITWDERHWVYNALEPALPVQLRRETQEQRLLAELAAAEQQGASVAVISFDFLVAGVHLEGRWKIIEARVGVGDPVYLERSPNRKRGDDTLYVMLSSRECIGLVPEDEAVQISQELDCGGRVHAFVQKILTDGQYPIPVIASRVNCVVVDDVSLSAPVASRISGIAVPSHSTWTILTPAPKSPASRWSISEWSLPKWSLPKWSVPKASVPKSVSPKPSAPKAAAPKSAAPKLTAPKESVTQISAAPRSADPEPSAPMSSDMKLIATVTVGVAAGMLLVWGFLLRS